MQGNYQKHFGIPHYPNSPVSAASSPLFNVFKAAQIKLGDKGFLSKNLTVRELVEGKSDVHHVFPKEFLKSKGLVRGDYNQVANYVISQSEIKHPLIGSREPKEYMTQAKGQCNGGERKYGNIVNMAELRNNLAMNCIPDGIENMGISDYPDFLAQRRKLMSSRIKKYFESLELN